MGRQAGSGRANCDRRLGNATTSASKAAASSRICDVVRRPVPKTTAGIAARRTCAARASVTAVSLGRSVVPSNARLARPSVIRTSVGSCPCRRAASAGSRPARKPCASGVAPPAGNEDRHFFARVSERVGDKTISANASLKRAKRHYRDVHRPVPVSTQQPLLLQQSAP